MGQELRPRFTIQSMDWGSARIWHKKRREELIVVFKGTPKGIPYSKGAQIDIEDL